MQGVIKIDVSCSLQCHLVQSTIFNGLMDSCRLEVVWSVKGGLSGPPWYPDPRSSFHHS